MAKPRVFVSSTHYDLRHVRASLENFIERLGYEAILSEKGNIAYSPDVPLDESCYREVGAADIFVLIVGGRYGAQRSDDRQPATQSFFERYESITKSEYQTAASRDIPIYIFIETNVYAEYHTFLKNKENTNIKYAHVDSVNIFYFIDDILNKPRNNPIKQFDRYEDIESWLRDQWAGLLKDFLNRASSQKQLASLNAQVAKLAEMNKTLKRYLEEVVSKVSPATNIVAEETHRLEEANIRTRLLANDFVSYAIDRHGLSIERIRDALENSSDIESFASMLKTKAGRPSPGLTALIRESMIARVDINEARKIVGQPPFPIDEIGDEIKS